MGASTSQNCLLKPLPMLAANREHSRLSKRHLLLHPHHLSPPLPLPLPRRKRLPLLLLLLRRPPPRH